MMACYRNASVLMNAGVAVEDAAAALEAREFGKAMQLLFRRTVAVSLRSVLGQVGRIARVVREKNRQGRAESVGA